MHPHEREEIEFQMGSATEHQNAYAASSMNRKPDDKGEINDLVAAGRHCVVAWHVEFCPHTDATLPGTAKSLIADFATRAEAVARYEEECGKVDDWDGEFGIEIIGPKPPLVVVEKPEDHTDCVVPF